MTAVRGLLWRAAAALGASMFGYALAMPEARPQDEGSPLFRDETTYGGVVGLIWLFFQSKRSVCE